MSFAAASGPGHAPLASIRRPPRRAFAYSLAERDDGWSWRVYDREGAVIASGTERTRQGARARIAAAGQPAGAWPHLPRGRAR